MCGQRAGVGRGREPAELGMGRGHVQGLILGIKEVCTHGSLFVKEVMFCAWMCVNTLGMGQGTEGRFAPKDTEPSGLA